MLPPNTSQPLSELQVQDVALHVTSLGKETKNVDLDNIDIEQQRQILEQYSPEKQPENNKAKKKSGKTFREKDFDTEPDEATKKYVWQCSRDVRFGFMRKVYGTLCLQMLVAFGIIGSLTMPQGVKEWAGGKNCSDDAECVPTKQHLPGFLIYIGVVVTFVIMLVLYKWRHKHPRNVILVWSWTVSLSLTLGILATRFRSYSTAVAALSVLILFMLIVVFTLQTAFEFEFKWFTIFCGIGLTGFWSAMIGINFDWAHIIAFVLSMLFTGYLLLDTWYLMHKLGPDDHIEAVVSLFTDWTGIFAALMLVCGVRQN